MSMDHICILNHPKYEERKLLRYSSEEGCREEQRMHIQNGFELVEFFYVSNEIAFQAYNHCIDYVDETLQLEDLKAHIRKLKISNSNIQALYCSIGEVTRFV